MASLTPRASQVLLDRFVIVVVMVTDCPGWYDARSVSTVAFTSAAEHAGSGGGALTVGIGVEDACDDVVPAVLDEALEDVLAEVVP
jgi:hypothetical protein